MLDVDRFKAYITPLIDDVVVRLGGSGAVRQLIDQLPEQTIYFVAGGVVTRAMEDFAWPWRGSEAAGSRVFSLEEIRRTLDLVRLRLETGSSTS